jgi:hypothetical protein
MEVGGWKLCFYEEEGSTSAKRAVFVVPIFRAFASWFA